MKFSSRSSLGLITFLAANFLMGSCARRAPVLITQKPSMVKAEDLDSASWSKVTEEVLIPQCLACHGAGEKVDLSNYESAKAQAEQIQTSVFVTRSMPPRKTLTERQSILLRAWLEAGMPLNPRKPSPEPAPTPTPTPEPPSQPTPTPAPIPAPEPPGQPTPPTPPAPPNNPNLQPTYSSIRTHILEPKCTECHSSQGFVDYMPFDTYDDLMILSLIVPGAPLSSRISISVKPDAPKLMPPKKSKIPPLTPEEIRILDEWILKGAPQN